jgi:hypothetical protein
MGRCDIPVYLIVKEVSELLFQQGMENKSPYRALFERWVSSSLYVINHIANLMEEKSYVTRHEFPTGV